MASTGHHRAGRRATVAVAASGALLLAPAAAPARVDPDVVATPVEWSEELPADWPTAPPASARSYVLVDADTGQVLASRAAGEPRVVASTVKLLTVLTALETLELDQEVVVPADAAVGGASTSVDPGETWQVADLVDAVLVRSGNDAARTLAFAASDGDLDAFVSRMQQVAASLGVADAVIEDPTGLDDANQLSARDLATIARAALADERIRSSASQAVVDLPDLGVQENRNLLVGEYTGATGLKTGFTDLAGYCLVASAERDGRELVAVVLGAREDPARFDEATALLDLGFEELTSTAWEPLRARLPGGWVELVPGGRVWGPEGQAPTVGLAASATGIELQARTGDRVLGTATARVPDPDADGVGDALAATLYGAMRQVHLRGMWPDGPGPDTEAGTSG